MRKNHVRDRNVSVYSWLCIVSVSIFHKTPGLCGSPALLQAVSHRSVKHQQIFTPTLLTIHQHADAASLSPYTASVCVCVCVCVCVWADVCVWEREWKIHAHENVLLSSAVHGTQSTSYEWPQEHVYEMRKKIEPYYIVTHSLFKARL